MIETNVGEVVKKEHPLKFDRSVPMYGMADALLAKLQGKSETRIDVNYFKGWYCHKKEGLEEHYQTITVKERLPMSRTYEAMHFTVMGKVPTHDDAINFRRRDSDEFIIIQGNELSPEDIKEVGKNFGMKDN